MSKQTPSWLIIACFAAIYIIWGSTYLAIGFAVQTIPPHIMAGARFLLAGVLMYTFLRVRGVPSPALIHWRSAFIVGLLLLALGNGSVSWAEETVPTGLAALIVAIVPLWMVLFDWLRPGGTRPPAAIFLGVGLGLVGMFLLIGPSSLGLGKPLDPFGVTVLISASIAWALGSIYSRHAPMPPSHLLGTGMEMLLGGALLWLMAIPLGEWSTFNPAAVSMRSWVSLLYLFIFGSLIAFSAYVFLLKVSTPARVSTYAFVNPVVAVFLGWTIAGETISFSTVVASVVIVIAVAIITIYQLKPGPRR